MNISSAWGFLLVLEDHLLGFVIIFQLIQKALTLIKTMTFTCQTAHLCAKFWDFILSNKGKFKMLCYNLSKHIECRGIVVFVHWNSNLEKRYTIFHNDHSAISKFYLGGIVSSLSFFTSDRVILSIWRNLQSECGNFDQSF